MFILWMLLVGFFSFQQANSMQGLRANGIIQPDLKRKTRSDDAENEWYPYGNKYFKSGGEKLTWEKASLKCAEYGGKLASIHSKEEQDFLITHILLNVQTDLWIGLHDRVNESIYEWEDQTPVDFTYWADTEPSGLKDEKEDCVEMVFFYTEKDVGKWNDCNCNDLQPYICQKEKDPKHSSLDARFCTTSNETGLRLRNSCFHLVDTEMTWSEAEKHCVQKYDGHLVAIRDFTVNKFLNNILYEFNFPSKQWIGIRLEGPPLLWSSDWHVTFSNFNERIDDQESCVLRISSGRWKLTPCNRTYPFVCEASSDIPSYLTQSVEGSSCPKDPVDWKDLGGDYCYHFETEDTVSWYQAHFQCMRRGGALASIHSLAEQDTLEQFIRFKFVSWIGLFRQNNNEEDFRWADDSKLDFKLWRRREPSSISEQCVEMESNKQGWNDNNCDNKNRYICSVRKVLPNITVSHKPDTCSGGLTPLAILGVVACVVLVVVLIGVFCYCLHDKEQNRKMSASIRSPSAAQGVTRFTSPKHVLVVKEDAVYENTW